MELKWLSEDSYLCVMLCMYLNECHSLSLFLNVLVSKLMGCWWNFIFPCVMWWWVLCWQYTNSHVLYVGSVLPCWELLVELSVVWGFSYLGTQWRLFRLCEAVERGPLRLCKVVVEDLFECCTLLHVWSSGEGKDVFTLFRLVTSIVPDVRCIDVFTHNSLRDKGDSLATLSGTHQTICSRN